LNSSLTQSAAELLLAKICPERANYVFCETFWILSKTGFLSHNFGSRYTSKSVKGSKDVDHSLVPKKTLSQKMAHWVGAQGLAKLAKNAKTSPHYDVTQRKKTFFDLN